MDMDVDSSSRISLAPRILMLLWLGAVPPLAAGLASGGVAAALGAAFAIACPMLVALGAVWPVRAPRVFPLYFAALFVVASSALPFNSVAFVVDTWSALLLALVAMAHGRPRQVDADVAGAPGARRRSGPDSWSAPRLVSR
jgi:hypothetical protein